MRFENGGRLIAEDLVLIEAIRKRRSILAASKATGISYRKCWLMVDALNRTFETAVIATHPGRRGGGAELTAFGERVVALYRSMERRSKTATAGGRRAYGFSRSGLSTTGQRRGFGAVANSTAIFPMATVLIIAQARTPASSPSRSTNSVVTSAARFVEPRSSTTRT